MAAPDPGPDLVAEIYDALDAGQPDRALKTARRLESASGLEDEALLAIAVAYLEAEKLKQAIERLQALGKKSLEGNLEFERIWHLAGAYYLTGRPQDALDLLYVLEPSDPVEQANVYWWRGVNHDLTGNRERADECFAAAHEADPGAPQPVNISAEEIMRIIKLVRARLPQPIQEVLDEVPVVVDDLPSLELIRSGAVLPDTLGLYAGLHLLERSVLDSGGLPPQIFLFRRNLERFARTRDELVTEIETTLLHELGHHLGFEEEGLDELGLA